MPHPVPRDSVNSGVNPPLWAAMLFPALAAGMGWGIRGQYGHETGAMIAGVLAALTLIILFAPHFSSLAGARAAAWMTAAIGIGGSMTYGQTVGLTHDQELVGHWDALRWGMLGLAIKGGLWIGFGGAFLGMGLGGKRYRCWELLCLMLVLLGLYVVGVRLLNSPFDPANRQLPRLYFSDHWYFEPDKNLEPRREVWGGLLAAWLGLTAYVAFVRRDSLAWRLSLWGFLGGAIGFPAGQSIQAYHAWNRAAMAASEWSWIYGKLNWWNIMETTFGAIWGGVLGLGVWRNRRWIPVASIPDEVTISLPWDVALCSLHLFVLLSSDFNAKSMPGEPLAIYTQWGLLMTIAPVAGAAGGRVWPFLMVLPIVAAPIVQKSMTAFCYNEHKLSLTTGWLGVAALPLTILLFAATSFIVDSVRGPRSKNFAAISLLLTGWVFFGLNTVFFDFAWPWRAWTIRTANQVSFMVCVLGLTAFALHALFVCRPPRQK